MEVQVMEQRKLRSPRSLPTTVRPMSATVAPRPPSSTYGKRGHRPLSSASVGHQPARMMSAPQFLCNADEEEAVLPRPLPPGIVYAASYTSFNELVDKQILTQAEEEKVHLSIAEVSDLYHSKCEDQGLQPTRKRESRFIQLLSQNCRGMHFALRENGLGASSAACIAGILADNEHFAVLDLSGNRLKDSGAVHVAELLVMNEALVHVALKSNDIGHIGAEKIAEALQTNNTVTSLDLSGLSGINRNHLGSFGARAFGNALAVNETLSILNLGANGLGNEGISSLASGLEHNQTLTELDLSSNNLGWEGCSLLGPLLNHCNLKVLNLEKNDIRDRGIGVLAQSLKPPNTGIERLEFLSVSHNGIRPVGFRWLAVLLRNVRSLKTLKADGNEGGDACVDVASAVKESRTIQVLSLSRCEITEAYGAAWGSALTAQGSLLRLEMQDNFLGDAGITEVAFALRTNSVLRHLDVRNNKIHDAGGTALAGMLQSNSALQHLNIRQNSLKLSGNHIAEAFRHNTTLLELDFAYNDFSFKSYSTVLQQLEKNHKIWRRQATPRLLSQIDTLKVDEATLHGTQEEIVQEIKRREITQENLTQKKEQVKQMIQGYSGNVKRLEQDSSTIAMHRAREEEAMAARTDELQREKQKQENMRRKIENKIKSEEEKVSRIKRDVAKLEAEMKAHEEQNEKELAPQRRLVARATVEQDKAKAHAQALAEALSKTEIRVKDLEKKLGISSGREQQQRKQSARPSLKGSSKPQKQKRN